MSHASSRARPLVVTLLLAGLLAMAALSGVARASTTQPVDEGGQITDCPVYSSSDPNCTLPAPPGGEGILCLDPALPCNHGGVGPIGGGGGGATTTVFKNCGGKIVSHFNGNPPVISEFANTHCPRSGSLGETRADFRAAYTTMSNEPECVIGSFIRLTFAAQVTSSGAIVSADSPHFGACFELQTVIGQPVLGNLLTSRTL
jgi:hypothetical protein